MEFLINKYEYELSINTFKKVWYEYEFGYGYELFINRPTFFVYTWTVSNMVSATGSAINSVINQKTINYRRF
jgi:hypothetical protein